MKKPSYKPLKTTLKEKPAWLVPPRFAPYAYGVGSTIHSSYEDALEQSKRNVAQDAKAEAKLNAEIDNPKIFTKGFAEQFKPLQCKRIQKILSTVQGINGVFKTRKDHVEELTKKGYTVVYSSSGRILRSPNDTYFTERDITKTAMDYAEYLNKKGE